MAECNDIMVQSIQKTPTKRYKQKDLVLSIGSYYFNDHDSDSYTFNSRSKSLSTQKCFDHPKQCKWTPNHCLKKEPNVCDDGELS